MAPDLNACLLATSSPESQATLLDVFYQNNVRTLAYRSAQELLERIDVSKVGCLILDIDLPKMSGIALWQRLNRNSYQLPCIFLSESGDISEAVRAMKLGAIDVLEYPLDYNKLLTNVQSGLASEFQRRLARDKDAEFESRINGLTKREREIMHMVAEGMLTKVIAKRLGICVKTVEVHRSNLTSKMGVKSVAQLVRKITEYTLAGTPHFGVNGSHPTVPKFSASSNPFREDRKRVP